MKIAFVFTGTWVFFFFAAEIWSWSSAVDCQYPTGSSGCLHLLVDIYVLGSDHKDSSYQTQPGETLPVPPLHKHSYLCSFGWAHFFSFCGRILDDILLVPVLLHSLPVHDLYILHSFLPLPVPVTSLLLSYFPPFSSSSLPPSLPPCPLAIFSAYRLLLYPASSSFFFPSHFLYPYPLTLTASFLHSLSFPHYVPLSNNIFPLSSTASFLFAYTNYDNDTIFRLLFFIF